MGRSRTLRISLAVLTACATVLGSGAPSFAALDEVAGLDVPTHPDPDVFVAENSPVVTWSSSYEVASIPVTDAVAVDVQGDYLYVARAGEEGGGEYSVYGISDPSQPTTELVVTSANECTDVLADGEVVYMALGGNVESWTFTPDDPYGLGPVYFTAPGNPTGLAKSGDVLYVADYDGTLWLYDTAADATLASIPTTGPAEQVVISGNLAFVACRWKGVEIFDVHDPTAPVSLASIAPGGWSSESVAISGGVMYVVDHGGRIDSYSIANPVVPVLLDSETITGTAWDIDVDGDVAYVTNGEYGGIQPVDIRKPYDLELLPAYSPGMGTAYDVDVAGDYAYVAAREVGVRVVRVTETETMRYLDSYEPTLAVSFEGLDVEGDVAYALDSNGALLSVAVTDPANMVSLDALPMGSPEDVDVDGAFAYVVGVGALVTVNASNPGNLTPINVFGGLSSGHAIQVEGDLAFVADGSAGLQVLDVENPGAPSVTGTLNTTGTAYDVFVQGDVAYIADLAEGLVCADISDPSNPTYLGAFDTTGSAVGVWVDGFVAYVAGSGDGLVAVDVSDPANPTLLAFTGSDSVSTQVAVDGDLAYLGDGVDGLRLFDVSDPAGPVLLDTIDPGDAVGAVDVERDVVYFCDNGADAGLFAADHRFVPNGWAWEINEQEAFSPPADPTTVETTATAGPLAAGTWWAHVRATQTRGPAGATVHRKIRISAGTSYRSLSGDDRYATAVKIAKEAYPTGAGVVVIATGENWPDALGGAALAGALDGPILLTPQDSLPSSVLKAIRTLGAGSAVILGQDSAVSEDVEESLQDELGAGNVDRIGGSDRYDTARRIAARAITELGGDWDGTAFVSTGEDFPDALAASPLAAAQGWPIYLTSPTSLARTTRTAMQNKGVTDVLVLGGTGSVSSGVETTLDTYFATERLSGGSRYSTASRIASWAVTNAGHEWDKVAIATGENFPDALAGGVLQGRLGSVMLLTPTASLDGSTKSKLGQKRDYIANVTYLGGTNAVARSVRDAIAAVLR